MQSWKRPCIFAANSFYVKYLETGDGSPSFFSDRFNQAYHSVHGAETESLRIFIELGFRFAATKFDSLQIFEMGFGTGLNAHLTLNEANKTKIEVRYTTLEAYPLEEKDYLQLPSNLHYWHQEAWSELLKVSNFFHFEKIKGNLECYEHPKRYNLVYFDAFAPKAQPELWTEEIFGNLYDNMESGGILTTYCSKGYVQRNLKAVGFNVEKHPGPPHKSEVLRAIKP